jgi:hypothetical protein
MLPFLWKRTRRRALAPPRTPMVLPDLCYPLDPLPRIAVLGLVVAQPPGVFCFPEWSVRQLEMSRPETLAGSYRDLILVAELGDRGILQLPPLTRPLLVLSRAEEGPLTSVQQESLWRHLRMPFYEQLRDECGKLLAYDCDAHEGFHVVSHAVAEYAIEAYHGPCPCGSRIGRVSLSPQSIASAASIE